MTGISRRQLCRFILSGGVVTAFPSFGLSETGNSVATGGLPSSSRIGAIGLANGGFAIRAINSSGGELWQTPVKARCHSGCRNPAGNELVFVERRPGWAFYVLDAQTGHQHHRIEAENGEHFVGHGAFSPDGHLLYLPASRYEEGDGIVAVYDTRLGYKRTKTLALDGIGPHEVKMHPDGRTLLIALGGILTHPDYDRIKLNIDTMKPALIMLDRFTGDILARFAPSNPQLSCRHLDIGPNGDVYAAYQYQGPVHSTPPLVARYSKGRFTELDFGHEVLGAMGNYIASIVAHPENSLVAVASPIGGTALIFDGLSGQVKMTTALPDCAGTQALSGGDFLFSTGQGQLVHLGLGKEPRILRNNGPQWDHHLV